MNARGRKKYLDKRSKRYSFPPSHIRHDVTTALPIDSDLIRTLVAREIIRYPMVASDERVYEAAELLAIFERGGISPYTRESITSAVYLRPLKNMLDRYYGTHQERVADYDVEPVMKRIQDWIETYQLEQVDMSAQYQLSDTDSDDDLVIADSEEEQETPQTPPQSTFWGSMFHFSPNSDFGWNEFYLPPVRFWPDCLNRQAVNVSANVSTTSELLLFLGAWTFLEKSMVDAFIPVTTVSTILTALVGVHHAIPPAVHDEIIRAHL